MSESEPPPTSAPSTTPPEIEDHDLYNEGDFTLISSDNVRFRLPSFRLFGASEVFIYAGTLAGNGERTIHFTDNDIETSEILELFFQVLQHYEVTKEGQDTLAEDMLLAGQFILFFKKYNCSGCIRAVLNSLFVSICPNGKSPGLVGAATVAACVAKDREAVGTLLCNAKYAGWEPEGMELASMDEDVAKGYDVRGYPFEVYAMLPPRFAFAITKTLTASNLTSSSRFDKKAEFYVLIEALSNKYANSTSSSSTWSIIETEGEE